MANKVNREDLQMDKQLNLKTSGSDQPSDTLKVENCPFDSDPSTANVRTKSEAIPTVKKSLSNQNM